jgi:hypothetical protein
MHKKLQALSDLCRQRGEPPGARRAIGRAQCNDAYWHGVFGGLYLPHLRGAIWRGLAGAEAELRSGEALRWEALDLDCDGAIELWIHSSECSCVVSPARGAAVEELTSLTRLANYAATLTRRREAYHLDPLPPVDRETRALFQERVWPPGTTAEGILAGTTDSIHTWALESAEWKVEEASDGIQIECRMGGLDKMIRIRSDGTLVVSFEWKPDPSWPAEAWFTSELSLFRELEVSAPGSVFWRHPIDTVSKSERGFDHTVQGESITVAWPASAGAASVTLSWPG